MASGKPLKRFIAISVRLTTGLKPGVNEKELLMPNRCYVRGRCGPGGRSSGSASIHSLIEVSSRSSTFRPRPFSMTFFR